MKKILFSGRNGVIPYNMWRKGFNVFGALTLDWESWCYGDIPGTHKRSPLAFGKAIIEEFKKNKQDALVIFRGADKSVRDNSIQPPFWHVPVEVTHNLMDSGITVVILERKVDPNNSLAHCELPRGCHLFHNDVSMTDDEVSSFLATKLNKMIPAIYEKTPGCCRRKWV